MPSTTKSVVSIAEPSNGGFQTLCLEDPDNSFARVKFYGRAMKLKTFGYPKSAKFIRVLDGDIEGVEIDPEPPSSGTVPLDTYTATNGRWIHTTHEVQCDEDNTLPPADVVIKNFVIWWEYEKTVSGTTTTYTLIEIIQVGMPACVHLGTCSTAHAPGPKSAKAKKPAKRPAPKKAPKRAETESK